MSEHDRKPIKNILPLAKSDINLSFPEMTESSERTALFSLSHGRCAPCRDMRDGDHVLGGLDNSVVGRAGSGAVQLPL